jgi:hypothetical protein
MILLGFALAQPNLQQIWRHFMAEQRDHTIQLDLLEGHGLPLFKKTDNDDVETGYNHQSGRNLVKWLFSESVFSTSMVDASLLKSLVIKRDPQVFDEFRDGLQEVLDSVCFHASNTTEQYQEHFIADFSADGEDINGKNLQLQNIITSALSIIPFTEPLDGTVIRVPQLIDNSWQEITYTIQRIQMTPSAFGAPYFAYGLMPNGGEAPGAQAQILFMGTNPIPTATGSHHTFMADTIPGLSVGEHLYLSGKSNIQEFINNAHATTGVPVIANGQSLGGSLAVLSHVYQPDKVQAAAFNPPAFLFNLRTTYERNLEQAKLTDETDEAFFKRTHGNKNPITIITNKGDPVFQIGTYIPNNAKIWLVSSDVGDNGSYVARHKDCYATHSALHGLAFESVNPAVENERLARTVLTILWQIASVPLTIIHGVIMIFKAIIHYIGQAFSTCVDACSSPNTEDNAEEPVVVNIP